MDEHEDHVYKSYFEAVNQQIAQLRVILQGVEAKAKERQWLKLKTSGDLDDLYDRSLLLQLVINDLISY